MRFEHPAVRKFQQTNSCGCCSCHERSKGSFDPCGDNALRRTTFSRRLSKRFGERVSEAAMRGISVPKRHVVEVDAPSDLLECISEAASAAIRLEGHPEILLKVPSGSGWIYSDRPQIHVGISGRRIAVDPHEKRSHPRRRISVRVKGPAALAGPEPCEQRLPGRRIITHVFRFRFSRRARRAAKNPGCRHREEENSVVRFVACSVCPFHFPGGRKMSH